MTSFPAAAGSPRVSVPPPSPVARLLAFFSGTRGLVLKIVFLCVVNAFAVWALTVLVREQKWPALGALVASTAAIDAIYVVPRLGLIPLKFLVPGVVFLVGFQLVPMVYTVDVAFTNWSTGHNVGKAEAIERIRETSLEQPPNGRTFALTPARRDGALVLLLVDAASGTAYAGTTDGLEPLPAGAARIENGTVVSADGFDVLTGSDLSGVDQELAGYLVPVGGRAFVQPQGLSTAIELRPTLRYDPRADTFTRISDGTVFRDDGKGSFVSAKGEALEPGWRTGVGFRNFTKIFTDPLIRTPFLRVFVWTVAYAALSVFFQFTIGLLLAITLNKPGLRLQRMQRSLLIIPFAIPSFLSILVWGGLLNDDFGAINNALGVHVPWLFDANWARVSVVLVNVWLGFPYYFLVCTGALQAVPEELVEAARVDGATALQVFRKVTMPLLLVAVAPLLIASFAFNFNNFNNIYLLTRGGPYSADQAIAGSTDILISYAYKVAFAAGKGTDYGLASAISIIIFFLIAAISLVSFRRTRALEEIR